MIKAQNTADNFMRNGRAQGRGRHRFSRMQSENVRAGVGRRARASVPVVTPPAAAWHQIPSCR